MDNERLLAMNAAMAEEFRANGGKIARFTDREILLLTTTGAKSGQPRLSPLAYVTDGSPDRLVIFASHLGAAHHPAWYHNLVANPEAKLSVRGVEHRVTARQLEGEKRDAVWREAVLTYPGLRAYELWAGGRNIPISYSNRCRPAEQGG